VSYRLILPTCSNPETPADFECESGRLERDMEREGIRDGDRDKQHDTERSNEKEGERDCGYPRPIEDQQRAHTGQDRRALPNRTAFAHSEGAPNPSHTHLESSESWAYSPSANMTPSKSFTRRDSLDASSRSSITNVTKKEDDRGYRPEIHASSLKSTNSANSISTVGNSALNTRGTQFSSPSLSPSPSMSPIVRDLNIKIPDRKQYGYSLSSASASACGSGSKQLRHVVVSPTPSVTQLETDVAHKQLDILIVDDSRLNRKMLCKVLRCKGHVCDEAEDGLEAAKKVEEKMRMNVEEVKPYFDAVFMDFVMPNMDGPTGILSARATVEL
jgi:CheY-like chemotaxis protein